MKKAIWILASVLILCSAITVLASTQVGHDEAMELENNTEEPSTESSGLVEPVETRIFENVPMYVSGDYVRERSAPNADSEVVNSHRIGDRITVVAQQNGWYKLANGGYIREDFVAPDYRGIVLHYLENGDDVVAVYISDQYVEYWRGDEILASGPCVSGNLYSSPTPIGAYAIGYKNTDFDMNDNPSTHVQYACFFNGGIALHDAPWRSEFGGDIYTWGGSHGCINMQYDLAKFIYEHSQGYTHVLVLP